MMRCAVLDDYQGVAAAMADWTVAGVDVTFFDHPLGSIDQVISALGDYQIVCLMRERTAFPRHVIEALPNLRLIVTTGMRNAAIDLAAARDAGICVCGTQTAAHPTVELVFAHLLEFCRSVGAESAGMRNGTVWQTRVGLDLAGKTFGIVGLGRLGKRVAVIAQAFGMKVVAWSENLTPEKCEGSGADYVAREELFSKSDFISIHLQLSERTTGLVGEADLSRMKPTAFLINTSRSPVIEQSALVAALKERRIAGAGLDVFDVEPLALDHPFRSLDGLQMTPHLGYVTEDNYKMAYAQTVEDIIAFLNGTPMRSILD